MPAKGQRIPIRVRFWRFVRKQPGDYCWEWRGARNRSGYGFFTVEPGELRYAHRVAYELEVGPIPADRMVCHRCDNPSCVRPDHLFLGTALDNLRDASEKGRLDYSPQRRAARCGEGNPNARLTWEAARAIRRRRAEGATYSQIRREFGVGMGTVAAVLSGLTWKEPGPPSAA